MSKKQNFQEKYLNKKAQSAAEMLVDLPLKNQDVLVEHKKKLNKW